MNDKFKEEMERAKKNYLTIISGKKRDKAVEALLEHFRDEEKREEYYQFFKELSSIYEIISPDRFLRDYLDDYETLSRMYKILRGNYDRGIDINKEFTRKTIELVKKHTKSSTIKPTLEVFEINEYTLQKLEKSKASDTEKVFNLIKGIEQTIAKKGKESPYLISIANKAEELVKQYEKRQKSAQETLEELKKIIEEINSAYQEQIEKNMPAELFTIYWMLKENGLENAEVMANEMRNVLEKYPHWQKSNKHEIEIRSKLYEVVIHSGMKDMGQVSKIVQNIMNILKMDV